MYCPKCGNEIPDGSAFCMKCGANLSAYEKEVTINQQKEPVAQETDFSKETNNENRNVKAPSKPKNKKTIIIAIIAVALLAIVIGFVYYNSKPSTKYSKAEEYFAAGDYENAAKYYEEAGAYTDAVEKCALANKAFSYSKGKKAFDEGDYESALSEFLSAGDYEDAGTMVKSCYYWQGVNLIANSKFDEAIEMLQKAEGLSDDVDKQIIMAKYGKAKTLQAENKYKAAAELYNQCGEYNDSAKQIAAMGEKLVSEGKYSEAIDVFDVSDDNKDNLSKKYALGMIEFEKGNYNQAAEYFDKASAIIPEAAEKRKESIYLCAKESFSNKNYSSALYELKKIKGYKDTDDLTIKCSLHEVEDEMKKGNLNAAQKMLKDIPADAVDGDLKAADMAEKLEKNSQWLKLCGKWSSVSGEARTTQNGSYNSYWWHRDIKKDESSIEIRCIINDDGSVNVKTTGSLFAYKNYSSISIGLEYTDISLVTNQKVTGMGTIKVNDNTSITLGTDKVKVVYNKKDNSQDVYFTYVYRTEATYERKTAY